MRAHLLAFGIAAIAAGVHGAVTLGPERPLGTAGTAPAAFAQTDPAIASNGTGYVAVWLDPRASRSAALAQTKVYATRLDERGRPAEPFGHVLDLSVVSPVRIASNGHGYVIAFLTPTGAAVQHLNDDGYPTAAPFSIRSDAGTIDIGTNRDNGTYLVAHANAVTYLNTDGVPQWTLPLPDSQPFAQRFLEARGSEHHVFQTRIECNPLGTSCTLSVDRYTVREIGVIGRETVLTGLPVTGRLAGGVGGDRLVLAYESDDTSERAVDTWVLDGTAIVSHTKRVLTTTVDCVCAYFAPAIGWDGLNFLVAWQTGSETATTSAIVGVRMRADGSFVDDVPFEIALASASSLQIAATPDSEVMIWRDATRGSADIVSRQVHLFGELIPSPFTSTLVSAAAPLQMQLQLAASGDNTLAVWRERDVQTSLAFSGVNCSTTIAPAAGHEFAFPSIATGGGVALVAWREEIGNGFFRILARRVGADCTLLDAAPIVLATEGHGNASSFDTTSVAFDGSSAFLIVWAGAANAVHGARVDTSGKLLDPLPIDVSAVSVDRRRIIQSPRALWDGSRWLVAWSEDPRCLLCAGPAAIPTDTAIYVAQVTSSGTVATRGDKPIVSHGGYAGARIGFAVAGGKPMLAWLASLTAAQGQTCLYAAPLTALDQTVNATALRCFDSSFQDADVDVAATNGAFVITWTEPTTVDSEIEMLAVDKDLRALTPVTRVSPSGIGAFGIATAVMPPSQIVIGYSRADAASGNVARTFIRTIDGIPGLSGRRRTVAH